MLSSVSSTASARRAGWELCRSACTTRELTGANADMLGRSFLECSMKPATGHSVPILHAAKTVDTVVGPPGTCRRRAIATRFADFAGWCQTWLYPRVPADFGKWDHSFDYGCWYV